MIILGTELAVQITEKEKRYNTVPLRVTEKGEANLNLKEQHKRIGKRSKAKGSSFERTVAKKFKDYYGEELTRTPQSGGFAKKSSKADGYIIYRATKKNGKYKQIKVIKSWKKTSFTDKKVKSKKTYYYKICPYKGTVNGPVSAAKKAIVK